MCIPMYYSMYNHHVQQSMNQLGKVAYPARGQPKRRKKTVFILVSVEQSMKFEIYYCSLVVLFSAE